MISFKKYMFGTALLVLLLIASFLCLHALGYDTIQTVSASSGDGPQNAPPGDDKRGPDNQNWASGQNQAPGGMPPQQGQGQRMNPPGDGMGGRMPGGPGGPNTGSKYALPLVIYAAVFLIVFITAYCLYKFNKFRINAGYGRIIILTLMGIGLVFRIAIANSVGGHIDLNIFGNWASTAAKNLFQVYSGAGHGSSDYPPLYISLE